ncbi:hypothetical protein QR680_006718 [Steinernema hermaphroditum]|uniref:Uncharacterized protein n=1 Tax=Steinernema hermaphroditum TaxID=289476 RepID=A0AA39HYH9_9BILA|nr:hypothetical protein QR680_006718 [Steinernema hermaphroditum]
MSTLFPVPSTGAVIPALFLEARMLQEHGCDAVAQMGVSMTADQCNLAVMKDFMLNVLCYVFLSSLMLVTRDNQHQSTHTM